MAQKWCYATSMSRSLKKKTKQLPPDFLKYFRTISFGMLPLRTSPQAESTVHKERPHMSLVFNPSWDFFFSFLFFFLCVCSFWLELGTGAHKWFQPSAIPSRDHSPQLFKSSQQRSPSTLNIMMILLQDTSATVCRILRCPPRFPLHPLLCIPLLIVSHGCCCC